MSVRIELLNWVFHVSYPVTCSNVVILTGQLILLYLPTLPYSNPLWIADLSANFEDAFALNTS